MKEVLIAHIVTMGVNLHQIKLENFQHLKKNRSFQKLLQKNVGTKFANFAPNQQMITPYLIVAESQF